MDVLLIFVNGKKILDNDVEPDTTLLNYLRNKLHLTGTKLGCGEGRCGACTVMVSKWDKVKGQITHISVNACLAPLVSMHMCAVTTVEGIGSTKTKINQVQKRLAEFHGSQCGFCTPGIIMSMYTLLRNNPEPDKKELDEYLQGNLCRCTGYRPIIAAYQTFTKDGCPMGKNCCRMNVKIGGSNKTTNPMEEQIKYTTFDPTQEPIFPPELLRKSKNDQPECLKFIGKQSTWFVPSSLEELLKLHREHSSRIVAGNSTWSMKRALNEDKRVYLISPSNVPTLTGIKVDSAGVNIGAACTITQTREALGNVINKEDSFKVQIQKSLFDMLHLFAGEQIRNVATLGQNIMSASSTSDIIPIITVASAVLTFQRKQDDKVTMRTLTMNPSVFSGHEKIHSERDEVLTNIQIPYTTKNHVFRSYKQGKKRGNDSSVVNAVFLVEFQENSTQIKCLNLAFGGVAESTKVPVTVVTKSRGRIWDESFVKDVGSWLLEDLQIPGNAHGGMVEYRRTLVQSLFFKFYMEVRNVLCKRGLLKEVNLENFAEPHPFYNELLVGSMHTWKDNTVDQSESDSVGKPVLHASALKHVTGEARYVDDMPRMEGELYLAMVTSTEAHAKITDVDISEAEKSPGFVAFIDHRDVPGENKILGHIGFANELVTCIGQLVGAVVADSFEHAQQASKLVKITYEKLEPIIVSIEDAVKAQSFVGDPMFICNGDVEKGFETCDHVAEGALRTNAQEHFYMETNAAIVKPTNEDGEIEIFSNTQFANLMQGGVASVMGVDRNKITIRVKRSGGGFGGKQTNNVNLAAALAVAANKCGRPVRCMLTRREDMLTMGTRHSQYSRYKVGFNGDGKIIALQATIYVNSGMAAIMARGLLYKTMIAALNCYRIPNVSIHGYTCKTNITCNAAMRGFGFPEGQFFAESLLTHVAEVLEMDQIKIRNLNMLQEGDMTHYNRLIDPASATFNDCWKECLSIAEFEKRKDDIVKFNVENKYRKRGIACVPAMTGIYITGHLSQGAALVNVYTDGSVLISHAGVELGQGLHTKMIQVASRALGVEQSKIHISESTTSSVANPTVTGASIMSDLNGMAVKNACEKINSNIEIIKKQNPNFSWKEIVNEAYMQRIQLSATGFYAVPNLDYAWDQKTGKVTGRHFNYYTCGAAVSEVEVDCLTGDHIVLQTDIVMDLGRSLNPAIDIGQIEGAFVQGYGMFTMEEPLHSPNGQLLTVGAGGYKIPGFGDIPKQFNIHLLPSKNNPNAAIYSSKAVGEPPLFLASSAFFAIKEAVKSARLDNDISGYFRFDSPATVENIRMACADKFASQSKRTEDENTTPWAVRP